MAQKPLAAVLVGALVLLAGCSGGVTSAPTGTNGGQTATGNGAGTGGAGTVSFYVSDAPNAIGDFQHLNVTVTSVQLHRAGATTDTQSEADSGGNRSAGDNQNETETEHSDGNETTQTTTAGNSTTTTTTANGSANMTETETTEQPQTAQQTETETQSGNDSGAGEWRTYEAGNRTVDLTELRGANATHLGNLTVPGGKYDAVVVHVGTINATLQDGTQVRVKLPSDTLKLNKGFEMGANQSVDFVFDITVRKAGNSGKYVLQPVISQSGTSVPIHDVDHEGHGKASEHENGKNSEHDNKSADNGGDGEHHQADGADLNASFVGNVTAGANATVQVTRNGTAVANATVEVDGEVVGTTGQDGTLTFAVPANTHHLKVKVTTDNGEVELERTLSTSGDGHGQGNDTGHGKDD